MPLLRTLCWLLAAALSSSALADTLRIPAPPSQHTAQPAAAALPQRGESMDQVRARMGPPLRRHPSVGGGHPQRPPITRWDYDGFYVIFERQRVIEAVRPDAPTPPRNPEGLEVDAERLPPA